MTLGNSASILIAVGIVAACGGRDPELGPRVERALGELLGAPVSVGSAEFDRLGRRVVVRDVTLVDAAGSPLLRARELVLSGLGLGGMGGVDPSEVELVGVKIDLRVVDGQVADWPLGGGLGNSKIRRVTLRQSTWRIQIGETLVELSSDELTFERRDDGNIGFVLRAAVGRVVRGALGQKITRLAGRGAWTSAGLELFEASLEGPGVMLGIADGHGALPLRKHFDGKLKFRVDLEQLTPWLSGVADLAALPPLAGRLEGQGQLRWRDGVGSGSAKLDADHLRVGDLAFGERATLSVRAADGSLQLHADVIMPAADAAAAASVTIAGEVKLQAGAPATLKIALSNVGMASLTARLGIGAPWLDGELDGEVSLSGNLRPLALKGPVDVTASGLRSPGGTALPLASIRLRGQVRAGDAGVTLEDMRLSLPPGARLGGLLLSSAEARLIVADTTETLQLEALRIRARGLDLRSDRVRLERRDGVVHVEGQLAFERVRLSDLHAILGLGDDSVVTRLTGEGRGSASLRYTGDREGLALEIDIELASAQAFGMEFDGGRVLASHRHPVGRTASTELRSLTLRRGDGSVRIVGSVVEGLRVELQDLPVDGLLGLSAGQVSGGGVLPASDGSGGLVKLTATGLRMSNKPLGDAHLTAAHVSARSTADGPCPAARMAWGVSAPTGGWMLCGGGLDRRLKFDIAVGDAEARPLRGEFSVRELPLSAWLPAPFDGGDGKVVLSARVELRQGGWTTPATLAGEVVIERLALSHGRVLLESSAPVTAPVKAGRLDVASLAMTGDDSEAVLSGGISVTEGFSLRGNGRIGASRLVGLSDWARRAFGDVGVVLELSGPIADPSLRATLSPRDVTVRVDPGGIWVHRVSGEVSIADGRLRVSNLRGKLGEGDLRLEGEGAVSGGKLENYTLALAVRNAELEPQPHFEVDFDADVKIVSAAGRLPRWTGEVRVSRMLYSRKIELPALLAAGVVRRRGDARSRASKDRIELDIRIVDSGSLRVRNNFLDVVLQAPSGLQLVGTDQHVGLLGELVVEEGRVMFRSDEFSVSHGRLFFESRDRVTPRIDVSGRAAAQKRSRAEIVFQAKGTHDRFDLNVRCEPGPGDSVGVPPPFACGYDSDSLHCGDFDQLVSLWRCQPPTRVARNTPGG